MQSTCRRLHIIRKALRRSFLSFHTRSGTSAKSLKGECPIRLRSCSSLLRCCLNPALTLFPVPPSRDIKLVPILVGSISTSSEKTFGALLAPYLADPHSLFVISSDFCHWGARFRYTHYHPPGSDDLAAGSTLTSKDFAEKTAAGGGGGPVWKGIEKLDHLGMEAIAFGGGGGGTQDDDHEQKAKTTKDKKNAAQAHDEFAAYLRQTKNTICGRHPIGVLLGALAALEASQSGPQAPSMRCEWVRYEQSSHVEHLSDSSVSYASAFVAFS